MHVIHPWFALTETAFFLFGAVKSRYNKLDTQVRRICLAWVPVVWLISVNVDDQHMLSWLAMATPFFFYFIWVSRPRFRLRCQHMIRSLGKIGRRR